VTLLQVRLVLAGSQQLGVVEEAVVGDEREAAVGGGITGDAVLVGGPADRQAGGDGLAVAGVGAGTATFLLPEALDLVGEDVEGDPAGRGRVRSWV